MRNILASILILAFSIAGMSGNWVEIRSNTPVPANISLTSSTIDQSTITFTLGGFFLNQVETPHGIAFIPTVEEGTPLLEEGAPDLPKLTSSLIIPDLAGMAARVIASSYTDFPNMEIAPSKGNLLRTVDPATVPYTYGAAYSTDQFYPGEIVSTREPFILRDLRGQTVLVSPFQYNPVTKVLRVYNEVTVELVRENENGTNPLVRKDREIRIEEEWAQIYANEFENFDALTYTPLEEYGNMLIISYGAFMDAMQPYVEWKTSIGFPVEMVDVSTIGASAAAIKSYIADYYNTNGLSYVLLVGDGPQIPTNTGGGLGGPSDNAYGYITGSDHYQELFVGRFSAESVSQVETQVIRSVNYEKDPQLVTDDWYTSVIGIASDQGPGDDNEYDYQHVRNMQTDCMGYTYTLNYELFDGSQGGNDAPGNPSPTQVATDVNDGASLIVYCGHGSTTSWGTSGFNNNNVNSLTNTDKLPFIFSVACINGDFVNATCFAEAWLRATDNDEPTGAIAFLGSTINQSWNPPMEGQDEMVDILVESYTGNIKRTFAGITINGCFKMNDTYGSGGNEMTDTWTVFGDPSVFVRTDNPGTMTVSHDPTLFVGSTSLTVNCNVEGARATASMNGEILATGLIAGGSIDLAFAALTNPADTVRLVVTAYNYIPYIADLMVITPNGPYIQYISNTVNDQAWNNDQLVDYGEDIYLGVALKNLGVEATTDLIVDVTTTNPFINQTDDTEDYGVVAPGEVKEIADGYYFHVSSNISDGTTIEFEMNSVDGSDSWTSQFSIMAHAPNLTLSSYLVQDQAGNNNGRLDPGEAVDLNLTLINYGSSEAYTVTGNLISISPYVTIVSDSKNFGDLAAGESNSQLFSVTVDPSAPEGQMAPFMLEISADRGLEKVATFNLVIGRTPILVIDLDGNANSGPELVGSAAGLGLMTEYLETVPADMSGYISVFVCLGIYPDKHALTTTEGTRMKNFLDNGGRAYMEGGDTWKYDPQTPVHPYFHILGVADGSDDLGTIEGQNGTFTEGMSFSYVGDNKFIDRIVSEGTGFQIFKNLNPAYFNAVAYDGGFFKTIGKSFEFGGLEDGTLPSTKQNLMVEYLTFFGIDIPALAANFAGYPTSIIVEESVNFYDFSTGGVVSYDWTFPGGTPATSTDPEPVVFYETPGTYDVTLTVSDGINTNTMTKTDYIQVDNITGLSDGNTSLQCLLLPNPNKGTFILRMSVAEEERFNLKVFNTMGTLVYQEDAVTVLNKLDKTISLPTLPNGVYIMTVQGEQGTWTGKIVVNK
ncbi:MAG: T9SS type A sorting domain-containing protein [Bacteroidales bacterium]|nr:T9SS type A sorting domain-containing protein [Bacteroidales bacterium]